MGFSFEPEGAQKARNTATMSASRSRADGRGPTGYAVKSMFDTDFREIRVPGEVIPRPYTSGESETKDAQSSSRKVRPLDRVGKAELR